MNKNKIYYCIIVFVIVYFVTKSLVYLTVKKCTKNKTRIIKKKMALEGYGADDHYGNDGWLNPEMIKCTLEEIFTE